MFKGKIYLLFLIIWLIWAFKLFLRNEQLLSESKVVFCDVGQGDAVLIARGRHQILIDGGPDESVLRCLRAELPVFDQTIETMVLTHADSDHFTGLTSVLRTYHVQQLIINNVGKTTRDFWDFYEAVWDEIEKEGLMVRSVALGESWCELAQICFQTVSNFGEILPQNIYQNRLTFGTLSDMINKFVQKSYDYNNGSIVLICQFEQFLFIFTGDAESPQELAMIADGLLRKVDVLKAGHHGSKSSSSPQFLSILQPETSIISCGLENSYGHPHSEVLTRLAEWGSKVYRTDVSGRIRFVKDARRDWHWDWERSPD